MICMENFLIHGNKKLYGQIKVDSAKNSLLPLMAASIMCKNKVTIKNITYYEDVLNMIEILKHLGVTLCKKENNLIIDSSTINKYDIPLELSNKLRASIFFLGPLLSLFKKARVAYPGGCQIGARPIDIHINGFSKMGAKIIDRHGIITANGESMKSNNLCLPFPSVGATENLIMASVFLKGSTTIVGAAKEPEIIDLCKFLNIMGAKISGMGSDTIHIHGVNELKGGDFEPIPDRIATGTYILAPIICGGEVEILNTKRKHIQPLIDLVKNNGCKIVASGDKIVVKGTGRPNGLGKIETMPYPFFPTDLSQPMSVLAALSNGNTMVVENLFENRFKHVPELIKMGAKITIKDRTAFIEGVEHLYGANVIAPDLRGGAALVLAGLVAKGYTTISNIDLIDRGYYKLEEKLSGIGADIKRN